MNEDVKKIRPKKRKILFVLLGFLILYVIGEYTIPRFPFGPFSLYSDLTEQELAETIPYQSLTDESSYPFVSANSKRNHEEAIRRFPTVRDCLVKNEARKDLPDLRLIDWDKIRNVEDADVCTWRILNNYNSLDKIASWFDFHRSGYVWRASNDQEDIISAKWTHPQQVMPFPTKGNRMLTKTRLNRGMYVSVHKRRDGQISRLVWDWQSIL